LVARLLWEQDAAGSNPVIPIGFKDRGLKASPKSTQPRVEDFSIAERLLGKAEELSANNPSGLHFTIYISPK
jgi:hypothetical protein